MADVAADVAADEAADGAADEAADEALGEAADEANLHFLIVLMFFLMDGAINCFCPRHTHNKLLITTRTTSAQRAES